MSDEPRSKSEWMDVLRTDQLSEELRAARADDPAVEAAVDGIRDELEGRADDIEAARLNIWRDPPSWDGEPSADLGVEVDAATIFGAVCLVALVALVLFFAVAVIVGAL